MILKTKFTIHMIKQIHVGDYLNNLLKDFEDFHDKKMIFAGDFNLIFDKNLINFDLQERVPFSKNIVYPRSLN